jgi:hypothetical protein
MKFVLQDFVLSVFEVTCKFVQIPLVIQLKTYCFTLNTIKIIFYPGTKDHIVSVHQHSDFACGKILNDYSSVANSKFDHLYGLKCI